MRRVSKKVQQRGQLVVALLQHTTLEKAAAAVGISATTAWRISKTPEFLQEQQHAGRKVYEHSLDRLQFGSSAAVSTILGLMTDPEVAAGCGPPIRC
jgi:hypothetical protein